MYRYIFHIIHFTANETDGTNASDDTWRVVQVSSETSTSSFNMTHAILLGIDVTGQTEVLHRPGEKGWNLNSTYSWTVRHQPSLNSLSISMDKDGATLWSHSWVRTFTESRHLGRVGVFTHSQTSRFYNLTVKSLCS